MNRYLIELTHENDHRACVMALRALEESGSHFVTHADWGCSSGVHCGWLIAEVESREDALRVVPPAFRPEARVVELQRFDREQIARFVAGLG
jgi:hypothetical protein